MCCAQVLLCTPFKNLFLMELNKLPSNAMMSQIFCVRTIQAKIKKIICIQQFPFKMSLQIIELFF